LIGGSVFEQIAFEMLNWVGSGLRFILVFVVFCFLFLEAEVGCFVL
jgi:hypothetical protein